MPFITNYPEGYTMVTCQFEEFEIVLQDDDKTHYIYVDGEVTWNLRNPEPSFYEYEGRSYVADLETVDILYMIVVDEDNKTVAEWRMSDDLQSGSIAHQYLMIAQTHVEDKIQPDYDEIDEICKENAYYNMDERDILGDPDE